jgi:catechol 2,3-dioxygenase-like lactoylglutathione lyase family enzyme
VFSPLLHQPPPRLRATLPRYPIIRDIDPPPPELRTLREERPMIPVRELRFVLISDDYDSAVRLFRDTFGLEVMMDLEGDGGRGVILRIPAATLELADVEHGRIVDEVETGRPFQDRLRVAVHVDALEEAGAALTDMGAEGMAAPVATPWGDRNQRFRTKDGLQLTLFQTKR